MSRYVIRCFQMVKKYLKHYISSLIFFFTGDKLVVATEVGLMVLEGKRIELWKFLFRSWQICFYNVFLFKSEKKKCFRLRIVDIFKNCGKACYFFLYQLYFF